MNQKNQLQHHRGFTLVEVLVAMTIILILAGLTVGGLQFVKTTQKNNQVEVQISLLEKGIEEYKLDNEDYPGAANTGGLNGENVSNILFQALYWDTDNDGTGMNPSSPDEDQTIYLSDLDPVNDKHKWVDGTGTNATIVDPWGAEFRYRRGGGAMNPDYDLWSIGKDGLSDGNGTSDKDKDDKRNF